MERKADEQFRALGYEPVENAPYAMYENKDKIAIEFADTFDEITKWDRVDMHRPVPFSYAEIEACHQLIKEQEASRKKDPDNVSAEAMRNNHRASPLQMPGAR